MPIFVKAQSGPLPQYLSAKTYSYLELRTPVVTDTDPSWKDLAMDWNLSDFWAVDFGVLVKDSRLTCSNQRKGTIVFLVSHDGSARTLRFLNCRMQGTTGVSNKDIVLDAGSTRRTMFSITWTGTEQWVAYTGFGA